MSKPDDISKAAHRANSVYENIYKQEQNRSAFINAHTPILPLRIDLTNFHHDYPVLNVQPILSLVNSVSAINYQPNTMNTAVESLSKINEFLSNYPQYDVYDLSYHFSEFQDRLSEYPELLSVELGLSDEDANLLEQLISPYSKELSFTTSQSEPLPESHPLHNAVTPAPKKLTILDLISVTASLVTLHVFLNENLKSNYHQLFIFVSNIMAEITSWVFGQL